MKVKTVFRIGIQFNDEDFHISRSTGTPRRSMTEGIREAKQVRDDIDDSE